MRVVVTGPMCSGTRLLTRILMEHGIDTAHDLFHANNFRIINKADRVIIIIRNYKITKLSWNKFVAGPEVVKPIESLTALLEIKGALWITYEQLCDDTQATMDRIASFLCIDSWRPTERLINQNYKYQGEVTAQLGPEGLPDLPEWAQWR